MRKATDEQCIAAWRQFGHLGQAAAAIGIHKSSLHERLIRLGVSTARNRAWSPQDDDRVRAEYMTFRRTGRVAALAEEMGRTTGALNTRAYVLGVTDPGAGEDDAYEPKWIAPRDLTDDRFRIGEVLMGLGATDERIHLHVLDGDPMSKARARFSRRGGAYTPASVREAEGRWVRQLSSIPRFTGNVALAAMFIRSNRQRIDVDNMLKLVADACTAAAVWDDDSQVTAMAGFVELDAAHPRTVLGLAPHVSSLQRGTDHWPRCATCGKQFNPAGRTRPKFCSQACRHNRPTPKAAA